MGLVEDRVGVCVIFSSMCEYIFLARMLGFLLHLLLSKCIPNQGRGTSGFLVVLGRARPQPVYLGHGMASW